MCPCCPVSRSISSHDLRSLLLLSHVCDAEAIKTRHHAHIACIATHVKTTIITSKHPIHQSALLFLLQYREAFSPLSHLPPQFQFIHCLNLLPTLVILPQMDLHDLDLQEIQLALDLVASWQLDQVRAQELWDDWEDCGCEDHDHGNGPCHDDWNYMTFDNKIPILNDRILCIDRFQHQVEATDDNRVHLSTWAVKMEDYYDPLPYIQRVYDNAGYSFSRPLCEELGVPCVSYLLNIRWA